MPAGGLATATLISGGISLLPALFKGISAIGQKNRANKINPINPGFAMNQGVIANAESLRNRVGNYMMPGYNKANQDIDSTYGTAFNNGVQGASSSGDVLDLATKIAYGQASAKNNLNVQNAQGRERAYLQSLEGNVAEGQQYQDRNAYDRDIYQQQLREKAGLTQAANENAYGALNSGASVASNALMQPKLAQVSPVKATPQNSIFGQTATPAVSAQDAYIQKLMQNYNTPYYNPNQLTA